MSTRGKIFAGGIAVVLVAALGWWKYSGSKSSGGDGDGDGSGSEASGIKRGGAGGPERPEPAVITGVVKTTDGKPIAAVVQANGDQTEVARAGADGTFEITGLRPGAYTVSAAARGYRPAVSAEVTLAPGARERVELVLEAGGNPITGRVLDISGGPIAGAFARLTPIAGILSPVTRRSFAAITGDDGSFELSAADGVYVLEASHPDYVSGSERVEVRGGSRQVEIALVPGGVIEGVVLDTKSGEPVGGALVSHRRSELMRMPGGVAMSAGGRGDVVAAGADGTFRISGLEPGVISLSAAGAGRVSREPVAISMGIAENRTGVEIYVDAGFTIRGVVIDQRGKPVTGATVDLGGDSGAESATSAADGSFAIGPVAPGSYNLVAYGGDVISGLMTGTQVEVESADRDGVKLEVRTGVKIRGRVKPAQIASVTLDLGRSKIRGGFAAISALGGNQTEADGVFEIGPVEPGKPVALAAVSESGLRGSAEVEVPESGADGVIIELGEAASIAGQVTDSSGKPVAGVFVSANPAGPVQQRVIVNGAEISGRRATTNDEGRYTIAGLEAGSYKVAVTDPQGQRLLWTRPADKALPDAPIGVELDDLEKKVLDLSVRALDGVIRGVVIGPDGSPAPDVFVTATASRAGFELAGPRGPPAKRPPDDAAADRPPDDGGEEPRERSESVMMVVAGSSSGGALPISGSVPPVVTGPDGRFSIKRLREGDYDLTAEGLGGSARAFADKVATGSDVRIELRQLNSLVGVVTKDGKPVEQFSVELDGPARHARSFRSDEGAFTMLRLDPGKYTLRVRGAGGETEMDTEIAAGKRTEVEVKLEHQLKVRGRLIDGDGKPVAEAMVVLAPAREHGEVTVSISSSTPPSRSDADGKFVTAALPGSYMLIALGSDGPLVEKRFDLKEDVDLGDLPATGINPGRP